jgi:hypothetical protein
MCTALQKVNQAPLYIYIYALEKKQSKGNHYVPHVMVVFYPSLEHIKLSTNTSKRLKRLPYIMIDRVEMPWNLE